jgi:hypothetical protein
MVATIPSLLVNSAADTVNIHIIAHSVVYSEYSIMIF